MPFNDHQALDLIEQQPETALKLEQYHFTNPKLGVLGQAAAGAVLVGLFLIAVAVGVDLAGGPSFDTTAPGVAFGAATFFFARLVTDLLEANKRDALANELGDLVTGNGKLSPNGERVIKQLEEVRRSGNIRIAGSTTPAIALAGAAHQKRISGAPTADQVAPGP